MANGRDTVAIVDDGVLPANGDVLTYNDTTEKYEPAAPTGGGGGPVDADAVGYNNTTSGLAATDVQAAIDELAGGTPAASGWDTYATGYVGIGPERIPTKKAPPLCHVNGDFLTNSLWVGIPSSKDGPEVAVSSVSGSSTITVVTSTAHGVVDGGNAVLYLESNNGEFWFLGNVNVTNSTTLTASSSNVRNISGFVTGSNPVPTSGTRKLFPFHSYDPNGCINIARTQAAGVMVMLRLWRQRNLKFQEGLNANDHRAFFWGVNKDQDALVIRSDNGNVGIGVSAPAHLLDMRRDGNSSVLAQLQNLGTGGAAEASFKARCNNTIVQFGSADGNCFIGTRSAHDSKFYSNDVLGFQLGTSGQAYMPNIGTTTNAGNLWINSSNGQLLRSTSLSENKDNVSQLEDSRVLDLEPVTYTSKCRDDKGDSQIGLIAEQCAEVDERFGDWGYDEEGKKTLQGINLYAVCVALLAEVKKLRHEVDLVNDRPHS